MKEMEALLCRLLWAQLKSMGLFNGKRLSIADIRSKAGLRDLYNRWLEESIAALVRNNYLKYSGESYVEVNAEEVDIEAAWEEWEREKSSWLKNLNLKTHVVLVEATMRALPEILTGKRPATDIIFPGASMDMVEGIYKHNTVADYFNEVLAGTVAAYIEERLSEDPAARIRILEIGAGTGGTSYAVFKRLQPYRRNMEEYCYTDISKAFLMYAEKTYGPDNPYLTYKIFNLEEPVAVQDIKAGCYDIVIAANVIHATKNIRQSLCNVKAVLNNNGLLILNEVTGSNLFTHLTFGLLEGWWLYEDPEIRVPGCPALFPQVWKDMLEGEGFRSVFFPAEDACEFGQQIIVSESDGVIRQREKIKPADAPVGKKPARRMPGKIAMTQASQVSPRGMNTLGKMEEAHGTAGITGQTIEDYVRETIMEKLSEALKVDTRMIDMDQSFADYGLDSITGVHLVQIINQALNVRLETTKLFDYSSVNQLAKYILSQYKDVIIAASGQNYESGDVKGDLLASSEEAQPVYSAPVRYMRKRAYAGSAAKEKAQNSKASISKEPIAVIGMSGKFAKSKNVNELWEHLANGDDLIEEVSRWDLSKHCSKDMKYYCNHGSFLDDIDKFDPRFFNISGLEASYMDPQQRVFLEECWKALEDAGYAGTEIQGRLCGVYAGYNIGDYNSLLKDNYPPQAMWGNASSVIPARIAYYLNLHGPAITVDTACSSSLVAIHLACQGLWSGETEMALAGGVFIQCTPNFYVIANKAGMLSPTGRCHTFDQRADGFVPGEGAGVVVLKRLSEAIADGDHIYGVIKGSGINQDGTTNGITAPSANSQERLERCVYDTFNINPEHIRMMEAHGTGTKLGDPIEFEALTRAFGSYTDKKGYCTIGSIKTNIGHVAAAAGVAGVIKILLALKHKQIPPSLHFKSGNSSIAFEDSPLYVNTRLKEWEAEPGTKRCAAVSAFGFSGTNAHMVIEEAPESEWKPSEKPGYLIVLSARTPQQLRLQAELMTEYCEGEPGESCRNVSYTLLMGRKHLSNRLACVVQNHAELGVLLRKWLEKGRLPQIYLSELNESERREQTSLKRYGNECIRNSQNANSAVEYMECLSAVAELYVQGYALEFGQLFQDGRYYRIPLPTYPFARERYWVREDECRKTDPVPQDVPELKTQESYELMTFEEVWEKQEPKDTSPTGIKTIICFITAGEARQAAAEAVQALDSNARVVFISQGMGYQKHSGQSYSVGRNDGADYREALKGIREDYGGADAILYMWAIEDQACIEDQSAIVNILQAASASGLKPGRILLAGQFEDGLEQCYLESWIGFERSVALAMRDTQVAVVYGEASGQDSEKTIMGWIKRLWMELQVQKAQSVLYREGQRHVCRIVPTVAKQGNSVLKSGGSYLIIGGCGGLGLLFAESFARKQPVNLILTGRSPMDEEKADRIRALEALGSRVMYIQADVCSTDAMKEGIKQAKECFGGINGVIHAAGLPGSLSILENHIQSFREVLGPKINGTLVLDEVLKEEALDFICYFSSSAAILGDFGSCDYSVGNRFQMAYAHYRSREQSRERYQGRTVVINWPLWRDGGMGIGDTGNAEMYLKSSGQRFLEAKEGISIFERILSQNSVQHLVLVGQRSRVERFLGLSEEEAPIKAPMRSPDISSSLGKGRRVEMRGLNIEQCLEWDLKEHISKLLRISRDNLDRESNLADFGFDSITLAEFARLLSDYYEIETTPAVFFSYSTIGKLGGYFLAEHQKHFQEFYREGAGEKVVPQELGIERAAPDKTGTKEPETPIAAVDRAAQRLPVNAALQSTDEPKASLILDEPIAIIGMSGRFPGARNIDELWNILSSGQEAIKEIPGERWDWRQYYGDPDKDPEKTDCKWCGCVPGVREFDPLFFEISPREAESMDPRQRLLLQEAWSALENAGYGESHIKNSKTGMFVGVEQGDYQLLVKGEGSLTSNNNAVLAARLAYFLNLDGPVMAIDTACSSGLVAVHQASLSLRSGECDTAIAAGVNLILIPEAYLKMSQAGMLSRDGRCFAFDSRANGLVPGEAVAVVVLKKLRQAKADGDPIYAVIRGSGVNYDGKTNGITAPSGAAQTNLLKSVYERYKVNPEEIKYIVAHGTGTKLGDPIEVNALCDAFKDYTKKQNYCAITSNKTNFGHTFAASGIVSLISLVQALRHETIPPSLNCELENDYINWKGSPFYVNKIGRPWIEAHGKRTGAVSAFGMSGTNVHMVLDSYSRDEAEETAGHMPCYLLALSAKTPEALQEKIKDMIATLESLDLRQQSLLQISYTLLEGRQHFNHRCAVVFQDREDAIYTLKQAAEKGKSPNLFQAKAPRDFTGQKAIYRYIQELLQKTRSLLDKRNEYQEILCVLADFYCQGYSIPWNQLFEGARSCRINLPGYPFSRQNYWISQDNDDCKTPILRDETHASEKQEALLYRRDSGETVQDDLMHLAVWEEQSLLIPETRKNPHTVLIVSSSPLYKLDEIIGDYLKQNAITENIIWIQVGNQTKQVSAKEWICGAEDPRGFDTCLNDCGQIDSLFFISDCRMEKEACSFEDLAQSSQNNELQMLRVIKYLKHSDSINNSVDCYIITQDNYRITDTCTNPFGGGITGLAYSIAQGDYRFCVRNIDISSEDLISLQKRNELLELILNEMPSNRGELVKLKAGSRYKRVFLRLDAGNSPKVHGLKKGGVYVILGGCGTVGAIITRYLMQDYDARVVWIGRKPRNSDAVRQKMESLRELGELPLYIQADTTDLEQMKSAVSEIKRKYPEINGAIFSGIVYSYEDSIGKAKEKEFLNILDVKTKGSINFYAAFQKEALDFMCYFSSAQAFSFSGAANLTAYASGITFSDTFVQSLQEISGFPVGTINWGFWRAAVADSFSSKIGVLKDREGFECFESFVGILQERALNQAMCMRASSEVKELMKYKDGEVASVCEGSGGIIMWKTGDASTHEEDRRAVGNSSALIEKTGEDREINQGPACAESGRTVKASDSTDAKVSREELEDFIKAMIIEKMSKALKISADSIETDVAFSDYGVDSIIGVSFIKQLNEELRINMNSAIIYDYTTVDRMADYILKAFNEQAQKYRVSSCKQIPDTNTAETAEGLIKPGPSQVREYDVQPEQKQEESVAVENHTDRPKTWDIAVIGMSGQFPDARDVNDFWRNMVEGHCSVRELPPEYLDQNLYSDKKQAGKTQCKWGGILEERDCFDPLFFNISPREAESMNPHQRLVLQESWKALEDAGYNPKGLTNPMVSMFIGAEPTGYAHESFTGSSEAIVASRLSYYLDLNGPALVVNTGCSSSGVAIHLACESLKSEESSMAVAGGVFARLEQNALVALSQIEMLSPTGRCKTFDESADGTILSEGVGIVVLKRLNDAIADGDHIYGVIQASGMNQDGTSNGITAPNGAAQERLITELYRRHQINPEDITYIEAHGTGTRLGDPIEANALVRAFRQFTSMESYCAMGSAKSFIGHTGATAGVAGLIRVLLSFQYHKIPGLVNFNKLNPLIELEGSPIYINTGLTEWKSQNNKALMAVLNSFGHSGTNVHLVIREYIDPIGEAPDKTVLSDKDGCFLVPFSAKNKERLAEYTAKFLGFLENASYEAETGNSIEASEKLKDALKRKIQSMLASILQIGEDEIEAGEDLNDYGVDQFHIIRLERKLQEEFLIEIQSGELSGTNSISKIASHIIENHSKELEKNYPSAGVYKYGSESGIKKQVVDLAAVAYTMQTGREPMEERIVFLVRDIPELIEKLRDYIEGKTNSNNFWQGYATQIRNAARLFSSNEDMRNTFEKWVAEGSLKKLAELWVQGFTIDWGLFYGKNKPSRIPLPPYPFAKEHYWMPEKKGEQGNTRAPAGADDCFIHPLLHRNTSDFDMQRFSSTFTGEEFFLSDHVISGQRILPGVAYLEMVRAAVTESSAQVKRGQTGIRLKNVVWAQPMAVREQPGEVHIGLFPKDSEKISYEIYGIPDEADAGPLVYSRGRALLGNIPETPAIDLKAIQSACSGKSFENSQIYQLFKDIGVSYGQGHRGIEKIYTGDNLVLARLSLPSSISHTKDQYMLHPCLMDSALQAAIGLIIGSGAGTGEMPVRPLLPFAMEELEIYGKCTPAMWVVVRYSEGSVPEDNKQAHMRIQKLDIDLCDDRGTVCVRMKGYSSRFMEGEADKAKIGEGVGTIMLAPCWKEGKGDGKTLETAYSRHIVVLCELGEDLGKSVEAAMPEVCCISMQSRYKDIGHRFEAYMLQVFEEIRKIFLEKNGSTALIQVVIPAKGEGQILSGLSGLLRTARLENPKVVGQLIEVDPEESPEGIIGKLREDSRRPEDDCIRYKDGRRWVAGWDELDVSREEEGSPWKDRGVYLITGGAGGLGLIFAGAIARQVKEPALVLIGRSPLDEDWQATLKELERLGTRVVYKRVDVTQEQAVEDLIRSINADFGGLNGIIHGAGLIKDSFIIKKTGEEIREVLGPKVKGLLNLDRASRELPLDFFIVFSSGVGVTGNIGQADYSAANAFMDAYARYRSGLMDSRERHDRILSINWPLWKEGGMRVDEETGKMMAQNYGMTAMETSKGILALNQALSSGRAQVMIVNGTAKHPGNIAKQDSVSREFHSVEEKAGISDGSLREGTLKLVKQILGDVIRLSPEKIKPETPFEKYGIDSIVQMNLIRELEKITGELSKTIMFEYNNTGELVDYLVKNHGEWISESIALERNKTLKQNAHIKAEPRKDALLSPHRGNRFVSLPKEDRGQNVQETEDIAVIGISGRYPLADTIEEFWEHLKAGDNCITEVPGSRWEDSLAGDLYSHKLKQVGQKYYGGFLRHIGRFDHHLFEIDREHVQDMSPETRLFMEIAWETFEDAGYAKPSLRELQNRYGLGVGVFTGTMYNQYPWSMPSMEQALMSSNGTDWHIANRVSHFFDLTGPSIAVNSACSSSLTAIHLACESLKQKSCSMAIAGGVNLTLNPSKYDVLRQTKYLGSGDRSKGFGNGDGYIPGEGAGAVLLKPLSMALKDNDRIYAVIKSSFVNHSGGRQMYTVPDPKLQAQLIINSIQRSGIDPASISYVEAAANGSELGDPIEVIALNNAFSKYTDKKQYCAIGTVKSNLGHLEAASGISQLSKVILQMKHKTLVPTINANPRNPNIKLENTAFYLQEEIRPWERMKDTGTGFHIPRRSLINSFGAGGAYANLIVEEFTGRTVEKVTDTQPGQEFLFAFSAKTEWSLIRYMEKLQDFFKKNSPVDIADVSRLLLKINHNLECRAAVTAASAQELMEKIELLRKERKTSVALNIYISLDQKPYEDSSGSMADVQQALKEKDLKRLASYWTAGLNLDFEGGDIKNPYIALPGYAFDHSMDFGFEQESPASNDENDGFYKSLFQKVLGGELSEEQFASLLYE